MINPHFDLFIQLLRFQPLANDEIKKFASLNRAEWEILIGFARQHDVMSLLYARLMSPGNQVAAPQEILEVLHQAHLRNAAANTIFLSEAGYIFDTLKQAGVDAIGLKGLYLIEHEYANIGLRSMSDMDILIRKRDIPEALAVHNTLGYQPSTYFRLEDDNKDIKHVPPLIKDKNLYLELHWTLLEQNEPFDIDIEGLWERAVPAKIAGVDTLALSLEDLILHLCIHLTYQHHLQLGLRGLYDIALVIQHHAEKVNWQALAERAQAWRAERVVGLTFCLLKNFFNMEISQADTKFMSEDHIPDDIKRRALQQLLERDAVNIFTLTPDMAELSSANGFFAKVKLALGRVFLPKSKMARLYHVDAHSLKVHCYYPVRLFELVRRYSKTAVRVLRGDEQIQAKVEQTRSTMDLKHWLVENEDGLSKHTPDCED